MLKRKRVRGRKKAPRRYRESMSVQLQNEEGIHSLSARNIHLFAEWLEENHGIETKITKEESGQTASAVDEAGLMALGAEDGDYLTVGIRAAQTKAKRRGVLLVWEDFLSDPLVLEGGRDFFKEYKKRIREIMTT